MHILLRAALAAGTTLAVATPVASAATYAVDTTADPLVPLQGCTAAANDCSLRGAITKANASTATPDTITLPAGTFVLDPTTALPDLTDDTSIIGAGARSTIIDGADGRPTVFAFNAGTASSSPSALSDLTVRNGGPAPNGASLVGNGTAGGTLTVSRVTITGNRSYALTNFGAGLTVLDSTVSGNTSPLASGVLNAPNDGTGILTIRRSTIVGNTATSSAGSPVVLASGVLNACTGFISDSTIVGNVAGDADHSAFGGNLVTLGTVSSQPGGCGIFSTQVRNTILADGQSGGAPQNCGYNTLIQSVGHNLDTDGSCGFSGPGDLSRVAAGLGALANNGGPTDTMLPASAASLVVDAGGGCTATDQRGSARPQGGACDIGAAESSFTAPPPPAPPAPPTTTVTTTVTTPAPAPVAAQSAPDTTPAKLTLSGLPARIKRSLLAKGLKVRVSANEPVSLDARLLAAPKKITLRALFSYVLAQASAPKAAGARTVTLKPAKKLAGTRPVKLQVSVVATDGGGNRTTAVKTITVS
jgi:hypothetical protein